MIINRNPKRMMMPSCLIAWSAELSKPRRGTDMMGVGGGIESFFIAKLYQLYR
jgi:hypothetical protein